MQQDWSVYHNFILLRIIYTGYMRHILSVFILLLFVQHCYAQGNDTTVSIMPVNTTTVCPGDTLHVYYQVNKKFLSGNIFSVQLSDATGGFTAGTMNVGSFMSDTNGRIICTIPNTTNASNLYRVRITATAPVRTSADNGVNIAIKAKPSIAPQSNSPVCRGGTITLNAHNATTGAIVSWTGPASYSAVGSPVTIPNALTSNGGKYYVTAALNGCNSVDSLAIIVNERPTSNLTTNSPVCVGDTMKLNLNWMPHTSNELIFPSGSKATNNQTYFIYSAVPSYAGTYTLVVTDTNNCKDTTYKNFAIKPLPDSPKIISNSPICSGKRLQLFGLPGSTTSASFTWTGPGGYTSTSTSPFINNATTADAGVYTLRTYYNGCYSASVSDTITIVDIPEKPIASSNSPICEGDGMKLTMQEVKGAYYLWVGPNNFKSNIRDLFITNITRLATGYYIVQDSISGGCVNADTIYVEVNPYPSKTQIFHNAPVCDGDTLKLYVNREFPNTKYNWWGPQITNDTGVILNVAGMNNNKTGMYGIIADNNGCITVGDSIIANTKPLPAVPLVSNNSPYWEGQEIALTALSTTPGVKYTWQGPNGYTDTGSTIYISNVQSYQQGTYFVSADKDGCITAGNTLVTIKKFSGIQGTEIALYPSPNNGNFFIDLRTATEQIVPVSIYSQTGQQVYSTTLQTDKLFIHHRFSENGHLAAGKYYLLLSVDGKKVKLPFVIIGQ